MVSLRSLIAAVPLLAVAIAQNATKIAFTSAFAAIDAGSQQNITWGGGDGTPVTLTLRRGDTQNLDTVDVIVDNAPGYYYIWTVPSSIENGDDYALQITQGQGSINYSGRFTIQSSGSSTTASSNSSMSITGAASATGTGTAMIRNSTFSSASLTSSSNGGATFGDVTSTHSRTGATTQATSAPSNDAPIRAGSSAALILGIVAAVMLH